MKFQSFLFELENCYRFSFEELLAIVKVENLRVNQRKLKEAYFVAKRSHQGQRRLSGESFINHPLFVAKLAAQLRLDEDSLIAALLHDSIEDGEMTLELIEQKFGLNVALIVDGLTNVRKTTRRFTCHEESVESFQKLLLASVEDIRVLLIRLCDKLHNGLTIGGLPPHRQRRFAKRVFHLYGPLAEYIGLGFFKRELEDIAFRILYPKEYLNLKEQLASREREREERVHSLINELEVLLRERKIPFLEIFGRRKGLYSIWKKMQRKVSQGKFRKADPQMVLDKIGVTVLTDIIASCYAVLGVVHANWELLPEEFDDYISHPKPNGYRSIQTTIKYGRHTAEIQIKTRLMHQYNEFGPASHIAYKSETVGSRGAELASYAWIKKLVSWREKNGSQSFRVKVFDNYVFAVTPKGDIIQLEKGSTPIDFAYRVHTGLGACCQGAKVNGQIVKLSYRLNNGDLVEIIKSKKPCGPKRDWLSWVKMKETKRKIRQKLKGNSG